MRAKRDSGRRWVVCMAGLFIVGVVSADNEVANGTFDSDVSGWTVGYPGHGTLEYSDLNAQPSTASGSALLTNNAIYEWAAHWVYQCVSASAAELDFGAQVMVPSGQATNGSIGVTVRWHDQPSCAGSAISIVASQMLQADVTDTWRWTTATSVSPPPGTVSAQVSIRFTKEQDSGTLDVHFDNVYLGSPGGIGEIFIDGFESGDITAWQ